MRPGSVLVRRRPFIHAFPGFDLPQSTASTPAGRRRSFPNRPSNLASRGTIVYGGKNICRRGRVNGDRRDADALADRCEDGRSRTIIYEKTNSTLIEYSKTVPGPFAPFVLDTDNDRVNVRGINGMLPADAAGARVRPVVAVWTDRLGFPYNIFAACTSDSCTFCARRARTYRRLIT